MNWEKVSEIIYDPISGEWGEEGEGIMVIRTTNFTNEGKLKLDDVVRRNVDPKKVLKKKLKYGDTIIEKSGGSPSQPVGRVVYFNISNEEYICNNFTSILRLKEGDFDSKYFFWFLFQNHQSKNTLKFQNKTTGIINLQLTRYVNELEIPLPDLATQKHIAEVLDKADALRQQNRQLLAHYDELLQSTFIELFGDPSKFEKVSGKKVVTLIGGGAFKSTDYIESGTPLIRIGAINKGYFDENSLVFLPNSFEEKYKGFLLKNGDLLMTLTGTVGKDDYGNVFILKSKYESYFLNQRVAKIICNKTIINEQYLLYYFKQEGVKKEITGISRGVRQANISNSDIYSHKFLIPPLPLQQHFAKIVEQIEAQKAQAQAALAESEALFEGLLAGYFNA